MKRLNPNTGKEFKRGEFREDGCVFYGYIKNQKNNTTGFLVERWADPIRFSMQKACYSARYRAKQKNLPFNLDAEYLMSIYTKQCPVFKTDMTWGCLGQKKSNNSPSLDRIIPSLGYVKGNVVFISDKANRIKAEFEAKDLYAVADWQHEITKKVKENVKALAAAPVSAGDYIQGAVGAELGSVSTPWTWEDDDDAHHHCGADARKDADHRAQESSGDSLGRGGKKVGAPKTFESFKDYWESRKTISWP